MTETIGRRIARYRQENQLTQEQLAKRIAVSRVAISHIEMGLSVPSERTITLLASVFKCTPTDLASGTTYAQAKADRLPAEVAWYTKQERELAVLRRDLLWLRRLSRTAQGEGFNMTVVAEWLPVLNEWIETCYEEGQLSELRMAKRELLESTAASHSEVR